MYIERLCLWLGTSKLYAMWTQSNKKRKQDDNETKTLDNLLENLVEEKDTQKQLRKATKTRN